MFRIWTCSLVILAIFSFFYRSLQTNDVITSLLNAIVIITTAYCCYFCLTHVDHPLPSHCGSVVSCVLEEKVVSTINDPPTSDIFVMNQHSLHF
jgi:hypothetical protein